MRRLAFLSTDNLEGFVSDDERAVAPLAARGWAVETVSWRQPCDWNRFDMVIIRSTWDYQKDAARFLNVLERIDASRALLQNDLELVRWNIRKTYLRDLQAKGNRIVPTIWQEGSVSPEKLEGFYEQLHSEEIIIKPLISANADHTFRLRRKDIPFHYDKLRHIFAGRAFMAQPFMKNIITEGEYSLFYFGGEYSHAILKTPQQNDFRVQEEHGGIITAVKAEEKLRRRGEAAMGSLGQIPLYARVDLVRDAGDEFAIMEVELIEPALYFRMDAPAAERFAEAVNRRAGGG
ncbi:MAG: hypothetical protein HUU32_22390 [Calditrichaceae bacterium]|nr:hypothetical protein [Calditrichia bacterium]NUQ44143.1 hypothetical protein [Calditrichaceae bacterium]